MLQSFLVIKLVIDLSDDENVWIVSGSLNFFFLSQGLSDIIPKDTLLWKLKLLKSAAAYANSRLHAVKAEVLLLARFLFSLAFMWIFVLFTIHEYFIYDLFLNF